MSSAPYLPRVVLVAMSSYPFVCPFLVRPQLLTRLS
jgi:hypothetical protein